MCGEPDSTDSIRANSANTASKHPRRTSSLASTSTKHRLLPAPSPSVSKRLHLNGNQLEFLSEVSKEKKVPLTIPKVHVLDTANLEPKSAQINATASKYTSEQLVLCTCGCGRKIALSEASKSPTADKKRSVTAALNMSLIHTVALVAHSLFSAFPAEHPEAASLTECLKSLIYRVSLSDLNVKPATTPVEYYPIWESDTFTMCLFVLKRGVTMPIHDHPQMTVFSKIVSGDLLVKTFEFTDDVPDGLFRPQGSRVAKIGIDGIISSSSPESLLMIRPNEGASMHSFTAASDTVVILDIIGPPYNEERPCTYYQPFIPSTRNSKTTTTPPDSASEYSQSPSSTSAPISIPSSSSNNLQAKKKKKKRTKRNHSHHRNSSNSNNSATDSVNANFDNLRINSAQSSNGGAPPDLSPMFSDMTQLEFASDHEEEGEVCYPTPPPDATNYCILIEDPDMDYECTERTYRGQPVRGNGFKAMEAVKVKDLLRLAYGVLGLVNSRTDSHHAIAGSSPA